MLGGGSIAVGLWGQECRGAVRKHVAAWHLCMAPSVPADGEPCCRPSPAACPAAHQVTRSGRCMFMHQRQQCWLSLGSGAAGSGTSRPSYRHLEVGTGRQGYPRHQPLSGVCRPPRLLTRGGKASFCPLEPALMISDFCVAAAYVRGACWLSPLLHPAALCRDVAADAGQSAARCCSFWRVWARGYVKLGMHSWCLWLPPRLCGPPRNGQAMPKSPPNCCAGTSAGRRHR